MQTFVFDCLANINVCKPLLKSQRKSTLIHFRVNVKVFNESNKCEIDNFDYEGRKFQI